MLFVLLWLGSWAGGEHCLHPWEEQGASQASLNKDLAFAVGHQQRVTSWWVRTALGDTICIYIPVSLMYHPS